MPQSLYPGVSLACSANDALEGSIFIQQVAHTGEAMSELASYPMLLRKIIFYLAKVLLADPGQELGKGAGSFLLQQSPLWTTRILRVCCICRCLAVITYGLCFSYGKEGTRDLTCDSTLGLSACLCVYQDCSRVTPAITCACHMSNWDLKTWVGQVLWEMRVGTRGCRKQSRAEKRWPGIVLPCATVTKAPH